MNILNFNNLDFYQKKIVKSNYNKLLITACAGSGKTKILVYRFLWLYFKKKYPLNSFIILTFANKAATEIKLRIKKYINNIGNLYLGTFHSIAYKIIKDSYKINKINFKYKILNNKNQFKLIKQIINENKYNLSIITCKNIQNYINIAKELGENFLNINNKTEFYYFKKIYLKYEKICQNLKLLDFNELIIKANNLLLTCNPIVNYYNNIFKNVLVDEFQDISFLQYKLLKIILKNKNLLIVGDDDQSIYGWRGVLENNLNKLKKDIPFIKLYKLEKNYRSNYSIIKCANQLIKKNIYRIKKKIYPNNFNKNFINVYKALDEIDEVNYIIKELKNIFFNYKNIKTIAILYRNNFQSLKIKKYLLKYKLYNKKTVFNFFIKNFYIKNIIKYIYFYLNPNLDKYFLSLFKINIFFLDKNFINKLNIIKKINNNISYWKIINSIKLINKLNIFLKTKIVFILNLIKNINIKLKNKILPEKILYLFKFFKNKNLKKSDIKIIKIFIKKIYIFYKKIKNNNNYSLVNSIRNDFKYILKYLKNLNKFKKKHIIKIKFLTIHKAKGLEFDKVFIIGLEQNFFPLYKYQKNNFLLEEERRLAYVGITRAKKSLTLSWCIIRDKNRYNYPSIFIKEIYNNFVKLINFSINIFENNIYKKKIFNNIKINEILVFHNIYGYGFIKNIIYIDKFKFYLINFKKFGLKKIIYNYKNLKLLN